jgi:hypothetical protein
VDSNVAITPEALRTHLQYLAYEAIFLSKLPPGGVVDVPDIEDYAATHLGQNTAVSYLEFGVANGDSLKRMAAKFVNPDTRFIGFDSFLGLPEDWSVGASERRIIPKGTFSRQGRLPTIDDPRVSYVAGWFQNTVPNFLEEHTEQLKQQITFAHFDADLYSANLFLLSLFWIYVPDYYFVMDDFFQDDLIALHDFTIAFPVKLEWIACRRNEAGLPTKTFGRLTRTTLQVDT